MPMQNRDLEQLLGHDFTDPSLLTEALRHASTTSSKSERLTSNERMEFLGDRVLGLAVATMLFHRFPDESEGEIARRFASLVSREILTRVATDMEIARYMDMADGVENDSVLADACEALIGALYLDGGMAAAEPFIVRHWTSVMEEDPMPPKDSKTGLQEWCQARGLALPRYDVLEKTGPAHAPLFTIRVTVETGDSATAKGANKRLAERAAAEMLLGQLDGKGA